jgi:hypothetical protein
LYVCLAKKTVMSMVFVLLWRASEVEVIGYTLSVREMKQRWR